MVAQVYSKAHQEVGQGVPEGGQARFAQKRRVVDLVHAHVGTLREVFPIPHSHVGTSFADYLCTAVSKTRHDTRNRARGCNECYANVQCTCSFLVEFGTTRTIHDTRRSVCLVETLGQRKPQPQP